MGLSFRVGGPSDVFLAPYDVEVQQAIVNRIGYVFPSERFEEYCSEKVAWSGWAKLQQTAVATLGKPSLPHLLAMKAWQGVYLPLRFQPIEIRIGRHPTPLQCGSLPELVEEMERFASSRSLPINSVDLHTLGQSYTDDDDLVDEDMDIQTYVQLMLTAVVATEHNLPLWVVK